MNPKWLVAIPIAMVLAFALGRYTAQPPRIQDSYSKHVDYKAAETTVAKVDAVKHEVATKDTDTTVRTVTRWLPAVAAVGGCLAVPAHVEQEVVRETKIAATRTADSKRDAQTQQHVEQQAQSTVVTLHTVESARPNWSVTAMLGVQRGSEQLVPSLPGHVVGGVFLSRRILGPVSIGIFGTTAKQFGAGVGLSW